MHQENNIIYREYGAYGVLVAVDDCMYALYHMYSRSFSRILDLPLCLEFVIYCVLDLLTTHGPQS